jgi:hypothetical protein
MTTTKLCTKCGKEIDNTTLFCPNCGSKQTSDEIVSPCSGVTAWVLCIFLGYFGAHRFYVGKIFTGILMLLTFGGLGIWYVYDYFSIPCRNFTDAQGRYLECQRSQAFPVVMTGIAGFVVLFYAAIIILISMLAMTEINVKDIARKQFTAIQANKLDEAYTYESPDAISSNDFNDLIKQHPEFSQSRSITFPSSKYNDFDSKSAKLEGQLVSPSGEKTTVHYEFKKQNKEWKIVKIEMVPAEGAPASTYAPPTTPTPVPSSGE